MKILEKRPLAIILCVMLGGFSFFADFSWQIKLIIAILPLLAIGIIYLFKDLNKGRKVLILITLISLSVSLLLSALWSVLFYPAKYYDENVTLTAKIYDIDYTKSSSATIVCKTTKINGRRDRHTLVMYLDKNDAHNLRKYDVVTLTSDLHEFSGHDDGFDGKSYYVSQGYSGYLDNVTIIDIHENKPARLNIFFEKLQLKISNTLKLRTNFETGAFLSALIVGDRTDLSGNVKLNFARLGISHILALSGMHLAILSLALNFLFTRLGINKRLRMSMMIAIIAFYMALTGFSASVVRAGIMLIISAVLYLISTKSDAITSLAIAVVIIVAFSPTSVFDLSLWLSAFATLGVIVFSDISEKIDEDTKFVKKALIIFKNGCLVSVFAFCATFAFTALRFDSFSVVSVITTLIFSFVIQLFIYGGLLIILLGWIIPLGKPIILLSEGIMWLAERISSAKLIYVSMNSLVVKMLIVALTVFFFAFLVLEIKSKRLGVAILVTLLISVFAVAEIDTLVNRYKDDAIYTPSFSGDTMILKSDGEVSAIYSGRSLESGAWDVLDILNEERLTYLDNLVIVSYTNTSIDFINAIIDGIKVEKIHLPRPTTKEELGQAEGISYLLSSYGTRMKFYEERTYLELGEYRYRLFEKADYKYDMPVQNVYEIVLSDQRVTYVSACEYTELSNSAKALLFNSKNLIIGTTKNTSKYIFDMRLPDIEKIYYYDIGRLTEDALKYYKKTGAITKKVKTPVGIFN